MKKKSIFCLMVCISVCMFCFSPAVMAWPSDSQKIQDIYELACVGRVKGVGHKIGVREGTIIDSWGLPKRGSGEGMLYIKRQVQFSTNFKGKVSKISTLKNQFINRELIEQVIRADVIHSTGTQLQYKAGNMYLTFHFNGEGQTTYTVSSYRIPLHTV